MILIPSTSLKIFAVLNKAVFCTCSTFISIPITATYISKPVNIAHNAPTTTGITITFFFMPYILGISSFNILYFSIFSTFLSFSRISLGMVTSTILTFFLVLSIITISCRQASILVSHRIAKSHRILYPSFSIPPSSSCLYQCGAHSKSCFSHSLQ